MSPDHPLARRLARHYETMSTVMDRARTPDPARRARSFAEVAEQIGGLLADDFVIHTAGIRLAATGDREFTMAMGKRRNALTGGTFRPVGGLTIAADDVYATVRGEFTASHGERTYRHQGMGAWRFNADGLATEHWELGPGPAWDAFFLSCDPDTGFTTAEEFWLRGTRP